MILVERDVLDLGRHGQVVPHGVEQKLYALVLVRRAQQDGRALERDGNPTDGRDQILGRALLLVQVLFRDGVVEVGDGFDHLLTGRLGVCHQLVRYLGKAQVFALRPVEEHCLHADEVDYALEAIFGADGDLHGDGVQV